KARGHEAVIATSGYYRQKVEALGLGFRAMRPDHPGPEADPDLIRRIMDPRKGSEVVIREIMMSVLRESYEDTWGLARQAPWRRCCTRRTTRPAPTAARCTPTTGEPAPASPSSTSSATRLPTGLSRPTAGRWPSRAITRWRSGRSMR